MVTRRRGGGGTGSATRGYRAISKRPEWSVIEQAKLIVPWRRSHVLAIQVYASPVRPHYIRREGLDRGVYVRVGSTNRRADRELIDELRRFARGEAYDEQPMPGLDSEALDFRAASESFAPVRRLRRTDLQPYGW